MPAANTQFVADLRVLLEEIEWIEERHLLEFLMLRDRVKPVVRVPLINLEEMILLNSFCQGAGLTLVRSQLKSVVSFRNDLDEEYVTWVDEDDPRPGGFVAYCGSSREDVIAAERAEREEDPDSLGLLFGYPSCCVEAYSNIADTGRWIEHLLATIHGSTARWQANKIAYAFDGSSLFPDYFPCSLSCEGTVRLTTSAVDALHRYGLQDIVRRHEHRMRSPIAVLDGRLVALEPSDLDGDWFAIASGLTGAERAVVPVTSSRSQQWAFMSDVPKILTFL